MIEPAAAGKAAEAYRTIGEVAEELKLPQHVLRFWETRFPQIRPLKRAGGRRFYSSEDLALLRAIKARLYGEGYTIKGVQRLLQEHGAEGVAAETGPAPASRDGDAPPVEADLAYREPPSAASPAKPIFAPEPPAAAASRTMLPALARLEALALDLQDCARLLAAARDPG